METVKFSKLTNFTGRNGFMKCSGVELQETCTEDRIILSPLTSRGAVGRCDIFIPKSDIPAVIDALRSYNDQSDTQYLGWCTDDILEVAKEYNIEISPEHAQILLKDMMRKHDASIGINWDVIHTYLVMWINGM